jgi:uncharacterized membrane protein
MEFKFSIRNAVREGWNLFKKHVWFFVAVAAIGMVLNFLGTGDKTPAIVSVLLGVAAFVWSIIVMKLSLAAADGKEEMFSFSKIQSMLPDWRQALGLVGVGLLVGLLFIGGLILLILPGIWIAFRLSLSNLAYLDKGEGIRKSVRASWDMTKGGIFWTTVLVSLTAGLLYIVGLVFFGVGILVTYPIAMILMAKFYRALTVHHGHTSSNVVVQPVEIVAPTPEVHEEPHHESETPIQ